MTTDSRKLEFPLGSDWRPIWDQFHAMSILKKTTIGALVLQAMQEFLASEKVRKK